MDRQERDIEKRAKVVIETQEEQDDGSEGEEQETSLGEVVQGGPVVSRYMNPDLPEENIRTDDAGNRYYNLFILPENFNEQERGSAGIPREPAPISEMNPTCKGPVLDKSEDWGRDLKRTRISMGGMQSFHFA